MNFNRFFPNHRRWCVFFLLFFSLCLQVLWPEDLFGQPYLSRLKADRHFPLYATYAAATSRSAYVLDEGYEFRYYIDSLAPDFITDSGVDLGIAFKWGERIVYKTADMVQPPVITASYPDMVEFVCYPFDHIRVEGVLLVYSSRIALMDWAITNLSSQPANLDVFLYARNRDQLPYSGVQTLPADNAFRFLQTLAPDPWTQEHGIPFADSVYNFWFSGFVPDKVALLEDFEPGENILGYHFDMAQPMTRQIGGRILLPEGERLVRNPPSLRLDLYVNGESDSILTERTLLWGDHSPLVDRQGYYKMEAGWLDMAAKTFRISAWDPVTGLSGYAIGTFNENKSLRADIALNHQSPPPATNLQITFETASILYLQWEAPRPGLIYSVYRREVDSPNPVFVRIADGLAGTFFKNILKEKKRYEYFVVAGDSEGRRSIHSEIVSTHPAQHMSFLDYIQHADTLPVWVKEGSSVRVLSAGKHWAIQPGNTIRFRSARIVQEQEKADPKLFNDFYHLMPVDLSGFKEDNQQRAAAVWPGTFRSRDHEALYWSAVNMMRQCFYPPEGKASYPYYVFSREPVWGWGHGGQVFHESLTMIAFARIDPVMAMQSQRIFEERQYESGYINYRTGPYLDEQIESNGSLTTSAPWYAWTNWEIYRITRDPSFLSDMYASSQKLYHFIVNHRDKDQDGLCEWGGHAVLESVRDALVAVWDQVADPAEFESLDLNCMLVNEARSLEAMALELGKTEEAAQWKRDYERRKFLINRTFWDPETAFYYQVDRDDHDFTYRETNDLKRKEIIGFLPLWSGVCDEKQAASLVRHLTDTSSFWRPYGIPSLSAADSYYQPKGYWNGPVWVEWNYLVQRGLLAYGYQKEATELADRVASGMVEVLRQTHNLWEFYSPDKAWGGHHKTYIWAGLIAEMLRE